MKRLANTFALTLLLVTIITSCSTSNNVVSSNLLQKRKYNKGFYSSNKKNVNKRKNKPKEITKSNIEPKKSKQNKIVKKTIKLKKNNSFKSNKNEIKRNYKNKNYKKNYKQEKKIKNNLSNNYSHLFKASKIKRNISSKNVNTVALLPFSENKPVDKFSKPNFHWPCFKCWNWEVIGLSVLEWSLFILIMSHYQYHITITDILNLLYGIFIVVGLLIIYFGPLLL